MADTVLLDKVRLLREIYALGREPSLAEGVAFGASEQMPNDVRASYESSNASLPSFQPRTPARWSNRQLNAAGYTIVAGPMKGTVVVADNKYPVNTLAHEAYHSSQIDAPPNNIKLSGERQRQFQTLMGEVQPATANGPYWGLRPSSSNEEQIASIKGYEGTLPKGTSILDSDVGRKLFPHQTLIDYYMALSSLPNKGAWAGQLDGVAESTIDKTKQAIRKFLTLKGINMQGRLE